jgi:RND family efflux transporter MFP subunit
MNKIIAPLVIVLALAGVAYYAGYIGGPNATTDDAPAGAPGAPGAPGNRQGGPANGGRFGGRGGRGGPAGPLTVELARVRKAEMAQQLTVVGNLIGDATVSVVPRAAGRLQDIFVRLGDQVRLGQRIAKIEDQELQEQVRQAEAAFEVSKATIRQREADLSLAKTNVDRARNLFQRELLPQQTLDDNEARFQAAVAQLDLARAQNTQSQARLDELKINLDNTNVVSPVDGFVASRAVDPGAFVGQNAPIVDVVDIRRVRLVVNVVEKDLQQVTLGDNANVNVDAFPGETFSGRIARVSPVLDATTRTATIELEIPNPGFRLKPGMYARVSIITANKRDALAVPANAVVDVNGRRGVYVAGEDNTARFRAIRVGIEEPALVEVLDGVEEGETVVTTGAAGLTDGARFTVAGAAGRNGGGTNGAPRGGGARGAECVPPAGSGNRNPSGAQATPAGDDGGEDATAGRRGRRNGGDAAFGDGTGRRGGRRGQDGPQPAAGN